MVPPQSRAFAYLNFFILWSGQPWAGVEVPNLITPASTACFRRRRMIASRISVGKLVMVRVAPLVDRGRCVGGWSTVAELEHSALEHVAH